ncbi:MAG: hypothetical protein NT090_07315 [Acidobacteria bacterium]|nr:hypothetical protein [Acidobacteriota bacterium]
MTLHRRDFVRAAAVSMTAGSYSRVVGANDRVQLGLIGCGGRGRGVMGTFVKTEQVNVAAVCDVYGERIDRAKQIAAEAKSFGDHRKLLEM